MPVQRVSGLGIGGAINPESLPITVSPGQYVQVYRVQLTYTGPQGILHICWGLKKGGFFGTKFNNGDGLQGGPTRFAHDAFTVPQGQNQAVASDVLANYKVESDIPEGTYNTFVWVAVNPTANETDILTIDTNDGVVNVVTTQVPPISISSLDVGYRAS